MSAFPTQKTVLAEKDANAALADGAAATKDIKSMEYHRQVLQSKMQTEGYVHAARVSGLF